MRTERHYTPTTLHITGSGITERPAEILTSVPPRSSRAHYPKPSPPHMCSSCPSLRGQRWAQLGGTAGEGWWARDSEGVAPAMGWPRSMGAAGGIASPLGCSAALIVGVDLGVG